MAASIEEILTQGENLVDNMIISEACWRRKIREMFAKLLADNKRLETRIAELAATHEALKEVK